MTDRHKELNVKHSFNLTGMSAGDWFIGCQMCGERQQYPVRHLGPTKCGICGAQMFTFTVRASDLETK